MSPTSPPPTTQTHDLYNLFTSSSTPTHPYTILILNQPLNTAALSILLPAASLLVCADGGANQYHKYQSSFLPSSSSHSHSPSTPRNPDAIIGDLDSIDPTILSHYGTQTQDLRPEIIKDADQYATDFMKCLRYISDFGRRCNTTTKSTSPSTSNQNAIPTSSSQTRQGMNVIVFGGLGGRVDQGFSQIHHLCLVAEQYQAHHTSPFSSPLSSSSAPDNNNNDEESESAATTPKQKTGINTLYLISEQSLSFILSPGHSTIHVGPINPPNTKDGPESDINTNTKPPIFTENTGILPLTGSATITTKGLEWDVTDWPTRLGGQVSTSNHLRREVVTVEVLDWDGPSVVVKEGEEKKKRGGEKSKMCLFTVELVGGLCLGS